MAVAYDYLHLGKAGDISNPKDRKVYRFFEILPGFLTWLTLILIVILSFKSPAFIAVFIILFDTYWLFKTIYLSLHMNASFRKMRANLKINWLEQLNQLETRNSASAAWQDIYHLIILPVAEEGIEVVGSTLGGLVRSDYPKSKMIVVLAQEERARENADAVREFAEREYGHKFFKFLVTRHPADLPGELAGKGANAAWAIKRAAAEVVDRLHIPYERVIVSNLDIDTVIPSQYFAILTYKYLTARNPLRSSFQPIPLYVNNIWEAPPPARVFAFATTFWQMIQQARPEQLVTFSSQAIGLKALADVGWWQTNVVSEDSRIFWQCLLRCDGDWETVPLHFPVYMDANVAPTFWQTMKNQYKQIRRWHWGVENNSYFMFGFLKNKKIPRRTKWRLTWLMSEKTHSAATNPLIIFLLGWLPLLFGGPEFNRTVLSFNLPHFTRNIMYLAMFGLVSSAIISVILLPPRPPSFGRWKWVWMFLQWVLFPVNFIVFGAIPAVDAQTRLMLGKYMGFWNTPKYRK